MQFPEDGSGYTDESDLYYVYYRYGQSHSVTWTDNGVDGSGEVVSWMAVPFLQHAYVDVWISTAPGTYPMEIYVNGVLKTTGTTDNFVRAYLNWRLVRRETLLATTLGAGCTNRAATMQHE